MYFRDVKLCGRLIDGDSVKMYASRLHDILDTQNPTKRNKLQLNVFTENWICTAVPEFKKISAPLFEVMKEENRIVCRY